MKDLIFLFFMLGKSFLIDKAKSLEEELIIGGDEARKNQFKYQVSLQLNGRNRCGGGIIDDLFIITAAHCVIDDETGKFENYTFTIIAASNDLNNLQESVLSREVHMIFVLKEYESHKHFQEPHKAVGDVAILKMQYGLGLANSSNLSKLQLPHKYFSYLRKTAVIAGYGYNKVTLIYDSETEEEIESRRWFEFGESNDKLRFARADVMSRLPCTKALLDIISTTSFCAKVVQRNQTASEGVCTGDSGSPLVYKDDILLGILNVSAMGCNENTIPGIYTRISHYLYFIRSVLNKKIASYMRVAKLVKHNSTQVEFVEI